MNALSSSCSGGNQSACNELNYMLNQQIKAQIAVASPASNLISPPTKVRFSPVGTCNPTNSPVSFSTKEWLIILPGLEPNCNPNGTLIVNSDSPGWTALKKPPSPNSIASAVVAVNEPWTSKLALSPKTIPLGFIRYKFAVPSTPKHCFSRYFWRSLLGKNKSDRFFQNFHRFSGF